MKEKLINIWKKLEPIHGIIYFVIILICSHFFWKLTMMGDETNKEVTFLGFNISAPFFAMTENLTSVVSYILKEWFGYVLYVKDTIIHFSNKVAVAIVWACSGLKQMYIYFCIIAFYRGPWKHKLWYIPMGLGVVYLLNVTRITVICAVAHSNLQLADFLHTHVLKYIFYAFIFLLWLIWEEKFAKKGENA